MEELLELKELIEKQNYPAALNLIGEIEEMSRDDKINKVESYLEILLLHLIKQEAEQRTTRSWELSIRNAVRGIQRSNKRRKAGGHYLDEADLKLLIEESFQPALERAALEALEGQFSDQQLAGKIDATLIKEKAEQLLA